VVLMGGIYSLWGAVLAGLLMQFLPALLNNWGVAADWLTIVFGAGLLWTLLTAPNGIVYQFPRDMAKLGRAIAGLVNKQRQPAREQAS
jgi:ABC-type branched-subunit amino acid transport system permease subunit